MSVENANLFKASLFRSYLEGVIPTSTISEIKKHTAVTLIVTGFFTSAFSFAFVSDSKLDVDFEDVTDDNGVSIKELIEAENLASNILDELKKEFSVTVSPWWDSDTTVKCNRNFELCFNCKTKTIKIIGCTFVKNIKVLPLATDTSVVVEIVRQLFTFYVTAERKQADMIAAFEKETQEAFELLIGDIDGLNNEKHD